MRGLIRSEWLKLITTRGTFLLLLGAVAINIFTVVAPGENALDELTQPLHEQQGIVIVSILMRVLLLVLGIRAVTEEFRHGTIISTLLATPRRHKVVLAKAIAVAAAGGLVALVTTATLLGSMYVMATLNDLSVTSLADSWRTLAGALIVGVIWPVVGLGVGLLVRSQVVAIVGGVVWLMGVEQMIEGRLGRLGDFLPGVAGLAGAVAPSTRALWVGSAALLAWALVASAAGALVMERRDVA
ncbi:MAG TPA: ABC transporter permease subunit [Actinomycetota bacterium]|jgi:ABC-type transport system involved in multi-copper enzyme maturation permease subunit|nr:ABC transporter permease subunit [Actinomycetota bacterium]